MSSQYSISIIGAGAWGITLAVLLARKGLPVKIWTRAEKFRNELLTCRENRNIFPVLQFLPAFPVSQLI